jgi:hypothetical protein
MLSQILEPAAADRLGRIRMVKESRATEVENRLIMLARSGQLQQKVTEDQLKQMLGSLTEHERETKGGLENMKVVRRGGWDDDDLDDLLEGTWGRHFKKAFSETGMHGASASESSGTSHSNSKQTTSWTGDFAWWPEFGDGMVGAISTIEGRRRTAERLRLRPSSTSYLWRFTRNRINVWVSLYSLSLPWIESQMRSLRDIKVILGGENG